MSQAVSESKYSFCQDFVFKGLVSGIDLQSSRTSLAFYTSRQADRLEELA